MRRFDLDGLSQSQNLKRLTAANPLLHARSTTYVPVEFNAVA